MKGTVAIVSAFLFSTVAFAQQSDWPGPKSITFVNKSSEAIRDLYISRPDQNDWAASVLPNGLLPGQSAKIVLDTDYCRASIKVVFANGDTIEKPEYNLCDESNIIVRPGGFEPK